MDPPRRNPDGSVLVSLPFPPYIPPAASLPSGRFASAPQLMPSSGLRQLLSSGSGMDSEEERAVGLPGLRSIMERLNELPR